MDVPTQLELCLYGQLDIASLLLVPCNPHSLFNFYLFLVYFLLYNRSTKILNLAFMQSHYACATPTFRADTLCFCIPIEVLKGLNSAMNDE